MERRNPQRLQMGDTITLNLKHPSFKDATTSRRRLTPHLRHCHRAEFHQCYRARAHQPRRAGGVYVATGRCTGAGGEIRARVVFNSRTGTVVMGDGVALHAAAVSHGSFDRFDQRNQQRQPAECLCGWAHGGYAAEHISR
ncbi:flagellar basal body P-ring protein FlgI [Escherichia coli]